MRVRVCVCVVVPTTVFSFGNVAVVAVVGMYCAAILRVLRSMCGIACGVAYVYRGLQDVLDVA